jgi:hypothetical protein
MLVTTAHRLAGFFLWGLIVGAPDFAMAQNSYQVEILLFSQSTIADKEIFSSRAPDTLYLEARLRSVMRLTSSIEPQPSRTGHLAAIRDILARNPNYDVLSHTHWIQDAPTPSVATWITIDTSMEASAELSGHFRLYTAGPLFFDTLVQYRPQLERDSPNLEMPADGDNVQPTYFLAQTRRLKLKEVHYFDHPRFGLLATIWPVGK